MPPPGVSPASDGNVALSERRHIVSAVRDVLLQQYPSSTHDAIADRARNFEMICFLHANSKDQYIQSIQTGIQDLQRNPPASQQPGADIDAAVARAALGTPVTPAPGQAVTSQASTPTTKAPVAVSTSPALPIPTGSTALPTPSTLLPTTAPVNTTYGAPTSAAYTHLTPTKTSAPQLSKTASNTASKSTSPSPTTPAGKQSPSKSTKSTEGKSQRSRTPRSKSSAAKPKPRGRKRTASKAGLKIPSAQKAVTSAKKENIVEQSGSFGPSPDGKNTKGHGSTVPLSSQDASTLPQDANDGRTQSVLQADAQQNFANSSATLPSQTIRQQACLAMCQVPVSQVPVSNTCATPVNNFSPQQGPTPNAPPSPTQQRVVLLAEGISVTEAQIFIAAASIGYRPSAKTIRRLTKEQVLNIFLRARQAALMKVSNSAPSLGQIGAFDAGNPISQQGLLPHELPPNLPIFSQEQTLPSVDNQTHRVTPICNNLTRCDNGSIDSMEMSAIISEEQNLPQQFQYGSPPEQKVTVQETVQNPLLNGSYALQHGAHIPTEAVQSNQASGRLSPCSQLQAILRNGSASALKDSEVENNTDNIQEGALASPQASTSDPRPAVDKAKVLNDQNHLYQHCRAPVFQVPDVNTSASSPLPPSSSNAALTNGINPGNPQQQSICRTGNRVLSRLLRFQQKYRVYLKLVQDSIVSLRRKLHENHVYVRYMRYALTLLTCPMAPDGLNMNFVDRVESFLRNYLVKYKGIAARGTARNTSGTVQRTDFSNGIGNGRRCNSTGNGSLGAGPGLVAHPIQVRKYKSLPKNEEASRNNAQPLCKGNRAEATDLPNKKVHPFVNSHGLPDHVRISKMDNGTESERQSRPTLQIGVTHANSPLSQKSNGNEAGQSPPLSAAICAIQAQCKAIADANLQNAVADTNGRTLAGHRQPHTASAQIPNDNSSHLGSEPAMETSQIAPAVDDRSLPHVVPVLGHIAKNVSRVNHYVCLAVRWTDYLQTRFDNNCLLRVKEERVSEVRCIMQLEEEEEKQVDPERVKEDTEQSTVVTINDFVENECAEAQKKYTKLMIGIGEEFKRPVVNCLLAHESVRLPKLVIHVLGTYKEKRNVTFGFEGPLLGWVGVVNEVRKKFYLYLEKGAGVKEVLQAWAAAAEEVLSKD